MTAEQEAAFRAWAAEHGDWHTWAAGGRLVLAELDRLRAAIRTHRDQRADDRCIEDDDRLYAALGDGIPCDRHVGDKAAMLRNCMRFIDRRCEGGTWPSYADLEEQIADLRASNAQLDRLCDEQTKAMAAARTAGATRPTHTGGGGPALEAGPVGRATRTPPPVPKRGE
jgi:hypothetical protein